MSTKTRNLSNIDGANVSNPTMDEFTSSALEPYANDAAFEADHGPGQAGDIYWNTTNLLVREHNGTAWQNDKTAFETQTDSTTTGASQDITPNTVDQVIRFTHGSLTSIRSIVPTNQKVVYFVNGQASQVITIKNEDTGATAANRIVTGTGSDFSLAVGQMIALVYDSGGTRWRLAGAASSGGSGTDGINLIGSPSTATGWSETGTVFATPVTTTTSGDLPLEGATNSAIQFVATNSGAEASHYNSYSITTSAAMNGKLQVDFFMRPGTGFAASEWTVSVYQGSTRQTLDRDSSGVCYLPNNTGRFTVSFDALASTAYTLRFARINGSGSATLNVCNVFLGWPFVSQITPMADLGDYTPSGANQWTTNATYTARQYQNGSRLRVIGLITGSSTPSGGDTANCKFYLPSGLNIDFTALKNGNTNGAIVGYMSGSTSGGNMQGEVRIINNTTTNQVNIWRIDPTAASAANSTAPLSTAGIGAATYHISFWFDVPIAEWAGSVFTGQAPDEQFLHNSTAWGTTNSSAFAYGPAGAAITGAAAASFTQRVRSQYPIQSDDEICLELSSQANGPFQPVQTFADTSGFNVIPFIFAATAAADAAGVEIRRVAGSTTDLDIVFGKRTWARGDASAYRDWINGWYWRVRITKKASLPYANAGTDGSAGLVAPYTQGSGVVYAGTYTATLTNGANVSASTFVAANYLRVGNQVQVAFQISVTNTTAASTLSILEMTLPVASNFTSANDANGQGIKNNTAPSHAIIYGSAANDRAVIQFLCQATAAESLFGQFMYTIK